MSMYARERQQATLQRIAALRQDVFYATQDAITIALSFTTAILFRYEGQINSIAWHNFLWAMPVAALVYIVTQWASGNYAFVWKFASVTEAQRLIHSGLLTLIILIGLNLIAHPLPNSVVFAGTVLTTMLSGLTRFQNRLFSIQRHGRHRSCEGLRVLMVGATPQSAQVLRDLRDRPRRDINPVGIVDSDPKNKGKMIHGIQVLAEVSDLERVIIEHDIHQLYVGEQADNLEMIEATAEKNQCAVRILPSQTEPSITLRYADVRDIRIDDLLGRKPIETDLAAVRWMIQGRRILITGAGGSIGSEIARQVSESDPATVVLLDHDETHLHDVAGDVAGAVSVLADIRDKKLLVKIWDRYRPEVVFHAAAHKHVPILEACPSEAVLTNILGTENVVAACQHHDVDKLVLISTDKAVHPSSVMGASKRMAEHLVLSSAHETGKHWCAVRFGNVLGSRGSVIPTFTKQIKEGGPVTVTDEKMTRYFMTIPEAVQLVLQASTLADGGEVFMLDMGEPVRILELAKRMIRLSGRRPEVDIKIEIVGARPGEKIHEELRSENEVPQTTPHPKIHRLQPEIPTQEQCRITTKHWASLSNTDHEDKLREELILGWQEKEKHLKTGSIAE